MEHTNVDARFEFTYDYIKRLQTKRFFHHGAPTKTLRVDYGYEDIVANQKTTTRVNNIQYLVEDGSQGYFRRFGYEYDSAGNISKTFTGENENLTRYFYDKQNQLVLEINAQVNETYEYVYDTYGNIRSKKIYSTSLFADYEDFSENGHLFRTKTINYGYTNSNFKDLLTSYDGHSLTYDSIGNPLSYYGATGQATLTWKDGRTLSTLVSSSTNVEYLYNEDGLRIKKDFETGDSHYYHYSGGRLVSESWGNKRLEFLYDESGIYGVYYTNGTSSQVFYFIKNLQGDVTEIVDQNMARIATYAYDAWGRVLYVKNAYGVEITDTNHIGYVNPIRYRGYYYDNETGLYYVSSRYYDPVVGRWISAEPNVDNAVFDEGAGLLGYNVYAYCANNPIIYSDESGEFLLTAVLIGAAVGAAIGAVSNVAAQASTGEDINWKEVGISAISGALTGAITAACPGMNAVTTGVVHGVIGAGTYAATEAVNGRDPTLSGVLVAGVSLQDALRLLGILSASNKASSPVGAPFNGQSTTQIGVDPNTLELSPSFTPNPSKYTAALNKIKTSGMYGVIDVTRSGFVLNGQHRVLIARKLGIAVDVFIK